MSLQSFIKVINDNAERIAKYCLTSGTSVSTVQRVRHYDGTEASPEEYTIFRILWHDTEIAVWKKVTDEERSIYNKGCEEGEKVRMNITTRISAIVEKKLNLRTVLETIGPLWPPPNAFELHWTLIALSIPTQWTELLRDITAEEEVKEYIKKHGPDYDFPECTLRFCAQLNKQGWNNTSNNEFAVKEISKSLMMMALSVLKDFKDIPRIEVKKCSLPECKNNISNKRLARRALYCSSKCRKAAANRRAK